MLKELAKKKKKFNSIKLPALELVVSMHWMIHNF